MMMEEEGNRTTPHIISSKKLRSFFFFVSLSDTKVLFIGTRESRRVGSPTTSYGIYYIIFNIILTTSL